MAVSIISGLNQANEIRNNATWSQGKIVIQDWSYYSKRNIVLGETPGNLNLFVTGVNILADTDLVDTAIPNVFGIGHSDAGIIPEAI